MSKRFNVHKYQISNYIGKLRLFYGDNPVYQTYFQMCWQGENA